MSEIDRTEVLLLLRGFTTDWEENVLFGDHRWYWENMKTMQGLAKHTSKMLSDSKYPDFSNAELISQLHLLNAQLRQFVTPNMRELSIQELEPMIAHGGEAYEIARRLIPVVEENEKSWCLCGHAKGIHDGAVCQFSFIDDGFPFEIDCECPSFRTR